MAIAPIFILLSLCIIISQEASVSEGTFENVKPMTLIGYDNNLGTYIEYKAQVEIEVGQHFQQVFQSTSYLFILQELLSDGYKALTKHCRELHYPNLKELNDTLDHLTTVDKKPKAILITRNYTGYDALKEEIEIVLKSPAQVEHLYRTLANLSIQMEKIINNLLTETKCARFNIICPSNKGTWNYVNKSINYPKSDDYLKGVIVNVGKLKNYIVFDYKIPEIDNDQFSIYRLTAIPKVHRNGTIEILNVEAPYLAVNDKKDRYFALQDFEDCLKLENNRFICKPNRVSKVKNTEDLPCGLAAVLNKSTTACASHLVVRQSLSTPLLAPNSWMATVTKEESLLAFCSDDDDEQELKITGSRILRIRSDCTVWLGTSVVFQGQLREGNDSNLAYASLHTTTEAATKTDFSQSNINQLVRDAIIILEEERKPYPYVIGAAVVLTILLFVALLYCHLHPRPRIDEGLGDAYQQLRVHFCSQSGKPDATGE